MSPTIRDVAEKAGVAPSTVSLVLNGRRWVSEDVRKTVTQAVESLQYKPRKKGRPRQEGGANIRRARSLKKQVALIIPSSVTDFHNNYLYLSIMHGLERACRHIGFNLILQSVTDKMPLVASNIISRTDGVIFMGESSTAFFSDLLGKVPFVRVMGVPLDGEPWDHVTYNNRMISRLAAQYLLKRGHKHCAFVVSSPRYRPGLPGNFSITPFVRLSVERQQIFVDTLAAAGAQCTLTTAWPEEPFVYCNESYLPIVEELKAMNPRPTAVFIPQDVLTERLCGAMAMVGMNLCRDFDVISCDNDLWAICELAPKPATIDLQAEYIGQQALVRLQERLAAPQMNRVIVTIDPRLVLPEEIKPQLSLP